MKKFVFKAALLALLSVSTCIEASAISFAKQPIDSASTVDKTVINNAISEFKSLSRKERKSRITEAKKALKDFKKSGDADTNTILLCILAILLPPLAIYLKEGEINSKFWIGLLLTLLFWLPGAIYAILVILGNA